MEYTVPNLEYAISIFYNGEQSERTQAHQWLTTAQRCPEAWSFVWELLKSNKNTEVQFFAATTLHTKILRCWLEVPTEIHCELKEKILEAVLYYSKGPKIVLNRLCISLAAYIMQQNINDLVTILRPLSSTDNINLLLEVLTVIPEEFNSMTMGVAMRSRNHVMLMQACPAVLEDMLRHLQTVYSIQQPSEETIELWTVASTCAASWMGLYGVNDTVSHQQDMLKVDLNERLPLCQALLHLVHILYMCNDAVSDSALEACESALSAVRVAGGSVDAIKYPVAALQLLTAFATLSKPIIAKDNVPNSINEELLSSIMTCAVGLGECHTHVLVKAMEQEPPHEGARDFLEVLIAGQASPGHYPLHETRSKLLCGYWYTLQDELLSQFGAPSKITPKWHGMFSRLLTILIEKCEKPSEENMSRDDAELLRCYRQDIADTVMYCYGVLNELCWSVVSEAWEAAPGEARREATLHVFLALADVAPAQEAPAVLFSLLRQTIVAVASTDNIRLLNTALNCLGGYANWLASLEDAEREHGILLTREALEAVGGALQKSPPSAALALRKLSTESRDLAAPLARQIALAAQNVNISSDAWVRRQLLGAAGAALSAAELQVARPLLQELATALANELLQEGLEKVPQGGAAKQAAAFMTALPMRSELASELFEKLLPALPVYANNPILVPSLFHVLRQSVTVLMDDCWPFKDQMSELTIQGFNTLPCPSGIDFVKLLLLMFGSKWEGCASLLNVCVAASARACVADASSNSDVTQALFSTLHAITKKMPNYMTYLNNHLPELVELGCKCVRLWEVAAARAACSWLAVLASEMPSVLRPYAPSLTEAALRCIGGATPRNQMEPLAVLLLALNCAEWDDGNLHLWLRQSLEPTDFPTVHATNEYKHKFITSVVKERNSKRRVLEYVQEFSLVCRGLVATEYGKQTLSSKLMVT